jgi:two-component system chemotaxis sensor kinase CheA
MGHGPRADSPESSGKKTSADPSRNYSEEEILGFVFLPGFSTLAVANTVSGRGVGMDVVRTEISRIGGREIRNAPEKGAPSSQDFQSTWPF